MKSVLARTLGALALVGAAATAQAAALASVAPALQLTLSDWAYGDGSVVQLDGYSVWAGGFGGVLSGASGFDSDHFTTYCIELEQEFTFSRNPMLGYTIVDGATYFQTRRDDAGIADRLGRLMTFVADNPGVIDTAAASTALQLAIWNVVYDTDYSLGRGGQFGSKGPFNRTADMLLAGAQDTPTSRYDVFALESASSQDFLLLATRTVNQPGNPSNGVPEPGSLALAGVALAGLLVGRRRAA